MCEGTHTPFPITTIVEENQMLPTNLLRIGPDSMLILPKLPIKVYSNSNQSYSYSEFQESGI